MEESNRIANSAMEVIAIICATCPDEMRSFTDPCLSTMLRIVGQLRSLNRSLFFRTVCSIVSLRGASEAMVSQNLFLSNISSIVDCRSWCPSSRPIRIGEERSWPARGSSMSTPPFPSVHRFSLQCTVCRRLRSRIGRCVSPRRKEHVLVAISDLFGVTDEAYSLLDTYLSRVPSSVSSHLKTPSFSPLLAITLLLATLSRPKEQRWKAQIGDLFAHSSGNEQVLWQMVSLPYSCLREDPRIQVLLLRACNSNTDQIKQLGFFSLIKARFVSFHDI